MGRYQFIGAIDYFLTDVRQPAVPHGVVCRYNCLMVEYLWSKKGITQMGVDRDLVVLALRLTVDELRIRLGSQEIAQLASQSINSEWLRDAQSMFDRSEGRGLRGGRRRRRRRRQRRRWLGQVRVLRASGLRRLCQPELGLHGGRQGPLR